MGFESTSPPAIEVMIATALRKATVQIVIGDHGPEVPPAGKPIAEAVRIRYARALHQLLRVSKGSLSQEDLHAAYWALSSPSRTMTASAWGHLRRQYPHLPDLPHRPVGRPTKVQASAGLGGYYGPRYRAMLRQLVETGAKPKLLAGSIWEGVTTHHTFRADGAPDWPAMEALLGAKAYDSRNSQLFSITPLDGSAPFIGRGSDAWVAILVLRNGACVEGQRLPDPKSPLIPIRPGSQISATAELIREICAKNL